MIRVSARSGHHGNVSRVPSRLVATVTRPVFVLDVKLCLNGVYTYVIHCSTQTAVWVEQWMTSGRGQFERGIGQSRARAHHAQFNRE